MGAPSAYCAPTDMPACTTADLEPGRAAVAGSHHGGAQGGERGGRRAARRHRARERVLSALRRVGCSAARRVPRGAARRAGARRLRGGSARAAGVLCGRSWRGGELGCTGDGGRRDLGESRLPLDVGGGEIDQPTPVSNKELFSLQSPVGAHTRARTHTETTERCVTPHSPVHEAQLSCGRSSRCQQRSGSNPAGLRARSVPRPPPAPLSAARQRDSARASGRRGSALRPLALEPGHGPAAATHAAAATAGTRWPSATRARARTALLSQTQPRTRSVGTRVRISEETASFLPWAG